VTKPASDPLLEITDLTVRYSQGLRRPPLTAVDRVSMSVAAGETVSVVGESGSGKTTLASTVLGLHRAAAGSVRLHGAEILNTSARQRKALGASLQAVFQDPFSSLDPSRTIGMSVAEPLRAARNGLSAAEIRDRTGQILSRVGIQPAGMSKYPAEFSGGQRQRIAIARALILEPEIVICDEAVSALDVSIQAQVLNLLEELQQDAGTSYLFISHNMAVVRHISDRVVVLYRGRVMEQGLAADVCERPAHPYTRALLASVPVPDVNAQQARRIARSEASTLSEFATRGDVGCQFAPRCPFAQERCVAETPALTDIGGGRRVACVRTRDIPAAEEARFAIRLQAATPSPSLPAPAARQTNDIATG
jgi:oligopeptide/dipeptide ABC transporter ATP-binding protein